MRKAKLDYHAKLIIYDLPDINEYRKSRLIQWLQATIDGLKQENSKDFSRIYTLKLMK